MGLLEHLSNYYLTKKVLKMKEKIYEQTKNERKKGRKEEKE